MKTCKKCGETKDVGEFHKDKAKKDGLRNECRDCSIARINAYRQSDRGRQVVKKYNKSDDRKAAYTKYNNSPKMKTVTERYIKTEKARMNVERYRSDHPEQWQAGNAVRNAVRRKRMPAASSLNCDHCGNPAKGYHHYMGYAVEHRFDVIPLCAKCHSLANRERERTA
jgi:hypothetical protein